MCCHGDILTVKLLATLSGLRRITVTSPTLCTCVVSVEGKMILRVHHCPEKNKILHSVLAHVYSNVLVDIVY